MSQQQRMRIRFPELSPLEAGRAAQKLKTLIQAAHDKKPEGMLSLDVERGRRDAQSEGEILVALFSAPAIVALVQGIRAYIAAMGTKVTIETMDAKVVATGKAAANLDVAKTVEKLKQLQPAPAAVQAELKVVDKTPPSLPKKSEPPSLPKKSAPPSLPGKSKAKGAAKPKSDKPAAKTSTAKSKRK